MKENRGITLIALVITIIVLLILAAITIASLTGENGILNKSKQSVDVHKRSEYKERIQIVGMGLQATRKLENWSSKKYMELYAQEIERDELFSEAEVNDPILYEEQLIIEVLTKEGWLYWVTENNIEYKPTGGIPRIEPTDVYVTLEGNTLKFYSTESGAKSNGGTFYGNVKDEEFVRVSWGKSSAPWQVDKDKIQKVEFVDEIAPTNMANYFYFLTNLNTIEKIENLKTENVTSMYATFGGCSSLTNLDVSKFNTSKVTNMNSMFYNCKFSTIDVSYFNTRNVTDMNSMFSTCDNLESLDVTNFNTSKVTDMSFMFQSTKKLKNLDLSNFNTSNVTSMREMFCECENLVSLNLSNFNTERVTNMECMFEACKKLINLDISNFNTEQVTNMKAMFRNCDTIVNLDVSSFDTNNVTNMREMFSCCYKLQNLDISNFNTQNVDDYIYMFFCCQKVKELNCQGFVIKPTSPIKQMFDQCFELEKLNIKQFDLENHTADKTYAFSGQKNNSEIITNENMKKWLNENYSRFSNIIVVD